MKRALEGRTGDTKALEREVERLRGEVEKKSRIIAEVVEENLGLKNGGSKVKGPAPFWGC